MSLKQRFLRSLIVATAFTLLSLPRHSDITVLVDGDNCYDSVGILNIALS